MGRAIVDDDNKVLLRYAGNLVQLWLETNNEDYPLDAEISYQWITPLGIPKTSYWAKFNSREELWGRIRMLGQLCNAEVLKASDGDNTIEIRL